MASKWDTAKPRRKKIVEKPLEICRVVPPNLANTPNIEQWLFRKITVGYTIRIAAELDKVRKELSELYKLKM